MICNRVLLGINESNKNCSVKSVSSPDIHEDKGLKDRFTLVLELNYSVGDRPTKSGQVFVVSKAL